MFLLHIADAILGVATTVLLNPASITIFPLRLFLRTDILLSPRSVSPASAVCVSVAPSLMSWCFTNSSYTLPFLFLLFCWQKLHWWKLTCKVDSFVCLIQSLISPLPSLHLCPHPLLLSTVFTSTLSTSPWARWLPSLNSPTCHIKWASVP